MLPTKIKAKTRFQRVFNSLGGKAVAVPGELLGYWEAHQRYGKIPWSELFKPSIQLCKTGARVNKYLADSLAKKISRIRAEPTLSEILINPRTNFTWTVGILTALFYFCLYF